MNLSFFVYVFPVVVECVDSFGFTFFNEFVVDLECDVDRFISECASYGIVAGVKIDSSALMLAATEMQTPADVETLCTILKKISNR